MEPLARAVEAPIFLPCNIANAGELEAVFDAIRSSWGRLDFLFHSFAWARKEDLHGRLADCSAERTKAGSPAAGNAIPRGDKS